jgi:hypothetical protein
MVQIRWVINHFFFLITPKTDHLPSFLTLVGSLEKNKKFISYQL